MSKKSYKSQASSSRAGSSSPFPTRAFGTPPPKSLGSGFSSGPLSQLSHVYEPPDLSTISDPGVVVSLKNIQKKDSTTKSKALEELLAFVQHVEAQKSNLDEAVIEAWCKLYPRISIDNARRVRQGAHTLHGQIATAAGKRTAKYMPAVVGAWLCGLNDSDKLVARAAAASFQAVFSSTEKRTGVWKAYQLPVAKYCSDIVISESLTSLSDMRTVNKDDAEAKYARVLGMAIATLVEAIDKLESAEITKQEDAWQALLQDSRLWKLCAFEDSYVRRSMYRLITAILKKVPKFLDVRLISHYIIYDANQSDRRGSATEYAEALMQLTTLYPEIWTSLYSGPGKKSAVRGLCHLLRKGSNGGSQSYWLTMRELLGIIPEVSILAAESAEQFGQDSEAITPGADLLKEMVEGIGKKEDRRLDNKYAWEAYLALANRIISLSEPARSGRFCKAHILPLLFQYITPSTETAQWTITSNQQEVCIKAVSLASQDTKDAVKEALGQISAGFSQRLQTSLPELSKDHSKSQDAIIRDMKRWYELLNGIQARVFSLKDSVRQCTSDERRVAFEMVMKRNGKPYSAAALLELQCRCLPELMADKEVMAQLVDFSQTEIPQLITSPSGPYLLRLLDILNCTQDVSSVYEASLATIDKAPESAGKGRALEALLASPWPRSLPAQASLEALLKAKLDTALSGQTGGWEIVQLSLRNASVPEGVTDDVLATIVDSLSISERAAEGLHGLDIILKEKTSIVREHLLSGKGKHLLSQLLFLSQSPDKIVRDSAGRLQTATERLLYAESSSADTTSSIIDAVRSSALETGPNSILIDSLSVQARKLAVDASEESRPEVLLKLLPSQSLLVSILEDCTEDAPDVSLALTNALHGAITLVRPDNPKRSFTPHAFDRQGFSSLLRGAMYCHGILQNSMMLSAIPVEHQVQIARFIALSVQLITDQLNVPSRQPLWSIVPEESGQDVPAMVVEIQVELARFVSQISELFPDLYAALAALLFEKSAGQAPFNYYHARAYVALLGEERDRHGGAALAIDESLLGSIRKSGHVIQSAAYLSTVSESNLALRVCNELMSDLSGTDLSKETRRGLERLVMLNSLLGVLDERKEDLPQQRLIFFMKHILPYLAVEEADQHILAEIFKTLNQVLPLVKDLYGEFWLDSIVAMCKHVSSAVTGIPTLHAILRLMNTLRSLLDEEVSEDLQESWNEEKGRLGASMIQLLMLQAELNDTAHQPLKMVNELFARQLARSHIEYKGEIADIFPIIACPSTSIQRAAYSILSTKIPQIQEQASLDAALSKEYVIKLPDEALSLILEIPTPEDFLDLSNESNVPTHLLRYLLSWKLIFTHWNNASYALQSGYVDALKDGSYLPSLLSLIFDVLIAHRPSYAPFDPSKLHSSIDTYSPSPSSSDDPATETQRLLTHLYYLSLLHCPSLCKQWWRNACPRALEKKVESWTEKHVSPLVIAAELGAVSAWDPNPDDTTSLEVRVSPKAREVTARYPVDEQHMAIRITLPMAYPLHPATVTTQARVGIDEKKWASWLNTSAIAINFASSSQGLGCVVDGLVAWRRNVSGTLKGQSECAICYSVVSADRQLPSKKCGTCKNLFHGSCLFRWFRSSSSSSCPLCRNAFNYA